MYRKKRKIKEDTTDAEENARVSKQQKLKDEEHFNVLVDGMLREFRKNGKFGLPAGRGDHGALQDTAASSSNRGGKVKGGGQG